MNKSETKEEKHVTLQSKTGDIFIIFQRPPPHSIIWLTPPSPGKVATIAPPDGYACKCPNADSSVDVEFRISGQLQQMLSSVGIANFVVESLGEETQKEIIARLIEHKITNPVCRKNLVFFQLCSGGTSFPLNGVKSDREESYFRFLYDQTTPLPRPRQ